VVQEGEVVGRRYRVEGPLGQGGQKTVYRATDLRIRVPVALALFPPGFKQEVLEREVGLMRRVLHTNVARLLDAGHRRDGSAYVVSELCEGGDLGELLHERGRLPGKEALPVLREFALGLEAIHKAHVLHRDIKPGNAVLTSGGLKIIDFGLSALGKNSLLEQSRVKPVGTLVYFAPELLGGRVDARTDVYALGVSFFEILCGAPPCGPLESINLAQFMDRLRHPDPWDLSPLPKDEPRLASLVRAMLRPKSEERPWMPQVVAALEALSQAPRPSRHSPAAHLRSTQEVVVPHTDPGDAPKVVALSSRGGRFLHPLRRFELHSVGGPEDVVSTGWSFAPWAILRREARSTQITALAFNGEVRWSTRIALCLTHGLGVDLDGDGVNELYLCGPGWVASLDARGVHRFVRDLDGLSSKPPTLWVADTDYGRRLVVDGLELDEDGEGTRRTPHLYTSDGERLVPSESAAGAALNGRPGQAFVGAGGTAAAILRRPGEVAFHVALLETEGQRLFLGVYGLGGVQASRARVCAIAGELSPEVSPLAFVHDTGYTVIVARLCGGPPEVVAIDALSGAELWRLGPRDLGAEAARPTRVLLVDLDGDGRPEVLFRHDGRLWVVHGTSGTVLAQLDVEGTPVGLFDPAGEGHAHLLLVGPRGLDLWRGPPCLPGLCTWAGARGDLWRSGCLGLKGLPLGPR
jgi:serine/threonine protein kinase